MLVAADFDAAKTDPAGRIPMRSNPVLRSELVPGMRVLVTDSRREVAAIVPPGSGPDEWWGRPDPATWCPARPWEVPHILRRDEEIGPIWIEAEAREAHAVLETDGGDACGSPESLLDILRRRGWDCDLRSTNEIAR
jgi:hypothetical protein